MRGLTWLIVLMLVLGAGGPIGSLFAASLGAAPAPAEDDDQVESAKPAFQLTQDHQRLRRCDSVRPLPPSTPASGRIHLPLSGWTNASTAFLAAGRLPLTC